MIELWKREAEEVILYFLAQSEKDGILSALKNCPVSAAGISVSDWNRQLSPWQAPRCFAGGEDFGGGADEFLEQLKKEIPAFEEAAGLRPARRCVCGYSLAGLCAVYALYESDLFQGAVSASGSMWFDGWTETMRVRAPKKGALAAYFSVGDKEKQTRNPRLRLVEDRTREAEGILRSQGLQTVFEINPGNHFRDAQGRLAKGAVWIAERWISR